MRRLFYKGRLAETIAITGPDAHHLMHVMRAKPGQAVVVVDDAGKVGRMEMVAFSPEAVMLKLREELAADTESPLELILAQCLLKADKMDTVVQKAVELGATGVMPIRSHNCVVRYDAKKAESRRSRWQKIADEAAKQCGRTSLVEVCPIASLASFCADMQQEGTEVVFCYENEEQKTAKACLQKLAGKRIVLLIGPEGGFTLEEAEAVMAVGGHSVTLGPRILRAETAAIAGLSIVQYEKGDLGS